MSNLLAAPVRRGIVDLALIGLSAADAFLTISDDDVKPLHVAFAIVAVGVLCLRHRLPYLAFAATIPALIAGSAVVATLIALYTVAEERLSRRRLIACAIAAFACYTSFWETPYSSASALLDVVYAILFTGAPVLLGLLVRVRADLSTQLVEIERARRHEQELLVDKALARERANLSREMHDVVSHQVSLIAVQAGALQVTARDDATAQTARTIRALSVQTLDELRDMVGVLRASGSQSVALTPQPGIDDVETLVAGSGIETTINTCYAEAVKPSAAVQRAIYRAVQEGLTNITKHAPGAKAVLELHIEARRVSLTLTNTKTTRPPDRLPSDRNGLLGLRERAELLGGSIQAGHLLDGGYRLSMTLPPHG